MTALSVRHTTVYRYARPVRFGEHRLMFRPRDSHDLRLVSTALEISPPPAEVRWLHDVFSNSIAIASFEEAAAELRFTSRIQVEHYGLDEPDFPLESYAQTYPFSYAAEEIPDLGRTIERHYPDPQRRVDTWVKGFLHGRKSTDTQALLVDINKAIGGQFGYQRRYALGTQTPAETIELQSGSCRDLALFMMEAVRSLGFAARFVTGYLYDPELDTGPCGAAAQGEFWGGGADGGRGQVAQGQTEAGPADNRANAIRGAGDTHAWVQIYLPGAGWMEFDPTNGLVGGARLIRVGVARDPSQAVPLQGTFYGAAEDFLDMSVDVEVNRVEAPQSTEFAG
ncbi:transglutaminase [Leptolyngbya valderiana BDU 20041]|nr:transglutaminase [Leptolyngbya valderiana BDU 20041]